jgi:transposase-like protein
MNCRHCGSSNTVKSGIVFNKQRYRCKDCGRSSRENDRRIKYSPQKKLRVLKLYLENVGIRSIERLEGVPNPLIIRWIRDSARIISELSKLSNSSQEAESVEILELDELYSYIKKTQ